MPSADWPGLMRVLRGAGGGEPAFRSPEGDEEGGDVLFLGGAGVELFAVSGDEGGGEILEEEGEVRRSWMRRVARNVARSSWACSLPTSMESDLRRVWAPVR